MRELFVPSSVVSREAQVTYALKLIADGIEETVTVHVHPHLHNCNEDCVTYPVNEIASNISDCYTDVAVLDGDRG